ncbi:hypothetical protein BJY14_003862 [Actinomadura luteofluorescens]|uniref:Uncharacterized protein n=1 Tax=Actinomadura luteofluorescens TaxID=46163 RepID=A0A7Y9EHM9_9ACTN|nr:hypothetical protein [Actinomadura luteofluorescens]
MTGGSSHRAGAGGVPARHGRDAQQRAVLDEGVRLPGAQADRVAEAVQALEAPGRVGCGDDGQAPVEFRAGDPVPVVAVEVGQDDGVQPRQVAGLEGGLGEAPGGQPEPEIGALPAMQEVGIGQQGERPAAQQCRRVADEPHRELA